MTAECSTVSEPPGIYALPLPGGYDLTTFASSAAWPEHLRQSELLKPNLAPQV